jgi:hypothetical protein
MLFKIFSVKRTVGYALCIPVYITLLYGCAHLGQKRYPQGPLEEVAGLYWTKRLVEKDYKFTYNLELEKDSLAFPDYLKKVKSAGQIKVLSVKVEEVKKDKDKAVIFYEVKYRVVTVSKILKQPLRDEWVFKSGRWLHKLSKK